MLTIAKNKNIGNKNGKKLLSLIKGQDLTETMQKTKRRFSRGKKDFSSAFLKEKKSLDV
jgi:hypothetical protein